jgi:hypothetical protein
MIEEDHKNNHKAEADIPRIIFHLEIYPPRAERDWEKRPFMDGHSLFY